MTREADAVILVDDLSISYQTPAGSVQAVRSVSFAVYPGETYGLVGESGSGKSTLALAMMGYLSPAAKRTGGQVLFEGTDLLSLTVSALEAIRGARIAMVDQNPQASLNPTLTVGQQVAEVARRHGGLTRTQAWARALELLRAVNMRAPSEVAQQLPHQLSAGMCQRVAIAMALCMDPDLLIMDEPTTNLDVTTEAVILDLIMDLKRQQDTAILYISHNLGVIARVSNRVGVMYAGELVEEAPVESLLARPAHPYTLGLLGCLPRPGLTKRTGRLRGIPGLVPSLVRLPEGCVFAHRCSHARSVCSEAAPPIVAVAREHRSRCLFWKEVQKSAPEVSWERAAAGLFSRPSGGLLLQAENLQKIYEESGGALFRLKRPQAVRAVDGVSIEVEADRILGLVGESGSGKTTLLRCIAGLTELTSGRLLFQRENITAPIRQRPPKVLRQIQVVFQDPESTLNPKRTVGQALGRALRLLKGMSRRTVSQAVHAALASVQLGPEYAARLPRELSGGEKQRVAIARAFAGGPAFVLCDEPFSGLDVSVQASILQLLLQLKEETGLSYLVISHDLAIIRYVADAIAVMYMGRLCEVGPAESFMRPPFHPYTEALLSAEPIPHPGAETRRIRLEAPVPSPADLPSGCVFHTRCPRKVGAVCEQLEPPWQTTPDGRRIRCHIPPLELLKLQERVKPSEASACVLHPSTVESP